MSNELPLISIVTPSYNQAQFLEETILSVLNQDYPNIEYIVIDGGSTDGSVEIIHKYGHRLAYWESELDRGQSQAINKGFSKSTGEILGWLNSDDTYVPGALSAVARAFLEHPSVQVVYGNANLVDENGQVLRELRDVPFSHWAYVFDCMNMHQASVFWRCKLFSQVGMLDERLHYAMDYDLFLRFTQSGARFHYLPRTLANYRQHPASKTTVAAYRAIRENRMVKRHIVREPGIIYSVGHYAFRLWRLFWFLRQGDGDYILAGLWHRMCHAARKAVGGEQVLW